MTNQQLSNLILKITRVLFSDNARLCGVGQKIEKLNYQRQIVRFFGHCSLCSLVSSSVIYYLSLLIGQ